MIMGDRLMWPTVSHGTLGRTHPATFRTQGLYYKQRPILCSAKLTQCPPETQVPDWEAHISQLIVDPCRFYATSVTLRKLLLKI